MKLSDLNLTNDLCMSTYINSLILLMHQMKLCFKHIRMICISTVFSHYNLKFKPITETTELWSSNSIQFTVIQLSAWKSLFKKFAKSGTRKSNVWISDLFLSFLAGKLTEFLIFVENNLILNFRRPDSNEIQNTHTHTPERNW